MQGRAPAFLARAWRASALWPAARKMVDRRDEVSRGPQEDYRYAAEVVPQVLLTVISRRLSVALPLRESPLTDVV